MSLITWLCTLFQLDVDPRFAGWLQCPLPGPGPLRHLSLELKGIDQSLRLRQLKVLGVMEEEDGTLEVRRSASQIQQDNCEGETLKVFRILTSQVSWSPSSALVIELLTLICSSWLILTLKKLFSYLVFTFITNKKLLSTVEQVFFLKEF